MKNSAQSVLFFMIVSFLPVIPIFTSFADLRNSVVLDQKLIWESGKLDQIKLPEMGPLNYEFRLESAESKWEPVIHAQFKILDDKQQTLAESPSQGLEWNLVRPFLEFKKASESIVPQTLEIKFLNSNPEKHEIRLKISKDRSQILNKHTRLFVILLALSLGLSLLVWKPFLTVEGSPNS